MIAAWRACLGEISCADLEWQAEKKARQREKDKERRKRMAEKRGNAEQLSKAAAEQEVSRAAAEAAALAVRCPHLSPGHCMGHCMGAYAPCRRFLMLDHPASRGKDARAGKLPVRAQQEAAERREAMAAAAEARMARLQLASQQQQLWGSCHAQLMQCLEPGALPDVEHAEQVRVDRRRSVPQRARWHKPAILYVVAAMSAVLLQRRWRAA